MAKPNALAIPSRLIAVGPAGANPPIAAAPQPKNTSANVPTNSAICLFTCFPLQNLGPDHLAGRSGDESHRLRFPIIGRDPSSQLNFRHNCGPERELLPGPRSASSFLFKAGKLPGLRVAMPIAKQFRRLGHIATTWRQLGLRGLSADRIGCAAMTSSAIGCGGGYPARQVDMPSGLESNSVVAVLPGVLDLLQRVTEFR
jgi:hypothetical protein